jgi:hypothetical protein
LLDSEHLFGTSAIDDVSGNSFRETHYDY